MFMTLTLSTGLQFFFRPSRAGPGAARGSGRETRSKVQGNMRHESEEDSSEGEDDLSVSRGDASDEELTVNSAARRRSATAVKGSKGDSTRGSSGATNGRVVGAKGGGRGGGSDLDSDEFLDDDDDDDDDEGGEGEDSAGSDDNF